MRRKIFERQMVEYLAGEMSPPAEADFKKGLAAAGIKPGPAAEYESLLKNIDGLACPEPGLEMRRKFEILLDQAKREAALAESPRAAVPRRPLALRPAAVAGLILAGAAIGIFLGPLIIEKKALTGLRAEVREMKTSVMLMMLDKPSAAERLKAVAISREIQPADDRIIEALLATLNGDPNVNVRLTAVEALARFADRPRVRSGLIEAMAVQDAAAVELTLADLMLAWREKRAVPQIDKLLRRDDLDGGIKRRFEEIRARLL
jgi:hypothetical protein